MSVIELDRAEHRAILADPRFHKALIEYCSQEGDRYLNQAKVIPSADEADEENQAYEVQAPLSIMAET